MFFEEVLGPWGRIIVVGIGSIAILFAILLIVCFLIPGCFGYRCITSSRTKMADIKLTSPNQQGGNTKLSEVSYRSWRLGSLYDNHSISENGDNFKDTCASRCCDLDAQKKSATLNLEQKTTKIPKRFKEFPTELTITLQFLPQLETQNISTIGKFVIGIEAISGLPPKQYNSSIEPYVLVEVAKHQSWTNRKREVLHSFKTRGIKHTASPIYRETFIIADVNSREAKNWMLNICAIDNDRFANHTELCNLTISLKNIRHIFFRPEIHLFNYKMEPSFQEFGSILLGVSYLPTARRLTITAMKLRNLKIPLTNNSTNQKFNPYMRVFMLNGKTGKKIKKKKTRVLQTDNQFPLNETLAFELSIEQLDSVQFLIVLCNKVIIDGVPTVDHPSDSEDSNSLNKCKDTFIGKVALGKGVRGGIERLHWFSVLQNPRKLVAEWHTLK